MGKLRREQGEWVTGNVARQAVTATLRHRFDEAVDKLEETGQIQVQDVAGTGQAGIRLRLRG